jgi:hypothetical protein
MASFPSSVSFASFLQYSPRGTSGVAAASRKITYAVKQDKFINSSKGAVRAIPFLAERIRACLDDYPFLKACFGPGVVLVPAPRSSPLAPGALWPTRRICDAFVAEGLGERVLPCLERVKPVTKSALAGPGERPGPAEHYESVVVRPQQELVAPRFVTLVDDVVTRGATFVGLLPHLEASFPGVPIRCFGAVRTMSYGDISELRSPVEGVITFEHDALKRQP